MTAEKGVAGEQKRWFLILQATVAVLIVGMVAVIGYRLVVHEIAQNRRAALASQLAKIQQAVTIYQKRYNALPTLGGQPKPGSPRELDEQRLVEVGLAQGFNHEPSVFNLKRGVRYGVTVEAVVFALDAQTFTPVCDATVQVYTAVDTTGRLTCNQLD